MEGREGEFSFLREVDVLMATVAEMVVNISAKASDFNKGINNTAEKLNKFGKSTEKVGKNLTKKVTAPLGAAGAAFGAATKKVIDNADQIAKNSRETGLAVEEYQKLEFAAGQAGLSQEQFNKSAGRLNTRIGKAVKGNEKYSEAFSNIGVELKDGEGNMKSTNQVFTESVDKLSEIEDSTLRAEAATEIFGQKAGRDMASLIEGGSEGIEDASKRLEEYGVISQEDAERAEQFNDSLDNFKTAMGGAFQELALKLLPKLNDLIPIIQEKVVPAFRDAINFIENLVNRFRNLNPNVQKFIGITVAVVAAAGPMLIIVGKIISAIGTMIKIVKAVGTALTLLTSPVGLVVLAIVALIAIGFLVVKHWDKIKEFLVNVWESIKDFAVSAFNAVIDFFKEWGLDILAAILGPIGLLALAIFRNWDKIKEKASEIWGKIKQSFETGVDNTKRFLGDLIKKGSNFVRDFIGFFRDIPSKIRDFGLSLFFAGQDVINSIVNGIKSKIGSITSVISGIAGTIRSFLPFSDAEKGPLSNLSDVDFGSSLMKALDREKPMIRSELQALLRVPKVGTERPRMRRETPMGNGTGEEEGRNGVTININGNMQVREEEDIERIAEQLFRLEQDRLRPRGVNV